MPLLKSRGFAVGDAASEIRNREKLHAVVSDLCIREVKSSSSYTWSSDD